MEVDIKMAKEFKISTLRLKELEQELFYLKTTREKEVASRSRKRVRSVICPKTANTTRPKTSRPSSMAALRRLRTFCARCDHRRERGCGGKDRPWLHDQGARHGDRRGRNYAIVGSQEANPMECRISDDSPFGKALSAIRSARSSRSRPRSARCAIRF